jgi:hypothetical protein
VWALQTDARREALAQKFLGTFCVPFGTPAPLVFELVAPCPANSVWAELQRPEAPAQGWMRDGPPERLRFFTM